jgi:hypothetical protein
LPPVTRDKVPIQEHQIPLVKKARPFTSRVIKPDKGLNLAEQLLRKASAITRVDSLHESMEMKLLNCEMNDLMNVAKNSKAAL